MIRQLYLEGMSISEIGWRTERDRKTVRKYACQKEPPEYKKREQKPSILEPYKDYINQRVSQYGLSAIRILDEIKAQGYPGKYTIVKDYVRSIKDGMKITAIYRYETKPGVQAQVDLPDFGVVELDGARRHLWCFIMVLGYSRMRYGEWITDIRTPTIIQCHINAFTYFGGYPKEILYDNIKQVVIKRALKSSESEWNPMFRDFFTYYGFIPRLCRPYRAQTKGKVENSVKFVRGNFFNGREFESLNGLNGQMSAWCNQVNSKVHGTTGVIPFERLKEEQLTPFDTLPPYQVTRIEQRKISRDCYVSYLGNKYSIPWKFAGRDALLQVRNEKFQVLVGGELICEHELKPGTGSIVRVKEHFAGLYKEIRRANLCEHEMRLSKHLSHTIVPEVEQRLLSEYDWFCNSDGEQK